MATKSILKSVNIKGHKRVGQLADALEYAERHRGQEVVMSRAVYEVKGDKLKDFFSKCQ